VIIFTHGGAEAVLERLAAQPRVAVVGVFIETEIDRHYDLKEKIRRSIRYDGYLATGAKLLRTLRGTGGGKGGSQSNSHQQSQEGRREGMRQIAAAHGVPVRTVKNYHDEESIALVREAQADLGVIYGTNILKPSVFKVPRLGSINLHRGLVPYYRGGPSVFWELFNGEAEAGLTVHFAEAKVDAGDVLVQEKVPLVYDYSYGTDFEAFITQFQKKHNERCAELLAEAVRQIAEGTATPFTQDITLGKRYRLPTKKEKDEMRRRLRKRQKSSAADERHATSQHRSGV
jgi:folate-dependent phosphoribosylglycinamide formyltransferase PurN